MKRKVILIVCTMIPVLAVVMLGFMVYNLSNTVGEIRSEVARGEADAILASADMSNQSTISVPILYYDQAKDECVNIYDDYPRLIDRQFEWTECGYLNDSFETGLVDSLLDSEFLPIGISGEKTPNRGINSESFKRWFSTVEGKSQGYAGNLSLTYNASATTFSYENEEFYPIDRISSAGSVLKSDDHNHLFTLNLGVPIQVLADGKEEFNITADDDTWVFIGNRMVIDMGGVHGAMTGMFRITNEGEVYSGVGTNELAYTGVNLEKETGAIIRIFHADRDSSSSEFAIRFKSMLLNISRNTTVAKTEDSDAVVAYNPEEPEYVAPLGESLTFRPNTREAMITASIVQTTIIVMMLILFVITTSVALRYSRRDRNQEE